MGFKIKKDYLAKMMGKFDKDNSGGAFSAPLHAQLGRRHNNRRTSVVALFLVGGMAPPASTRISARLKRVGEHSSSVCV